MTERKKPPKTLDMGFDEALTRFLKTDPRELAESIAGEVLEQNKASKKRMDEVRKELDDGARPRKGRFRL